VETSLLELAETLLRIMGSSLAVEHAPERSVNSVRRRLADVTNARRELGFEARVGLEEGLRELVQWWHHEKERLSVA
jgi:UDP-glucose 4-epimerase